MSMRTTVKVPLNKMPCACPARHQPCAGHLAVFPHRLNPEPVWRQDPILYGKDRAPSSLSIFQEVNPAIPPPSS